MSDWGEGTRSVWGGETETGGGAPTQVPIVRSVAFGYDDTDGWLDAALGRVPGHIYSRNTNPTVAVFEEKIRLLEGAEAATAFASGMAAISGTLLTLLSPGDRVVSIRDSYGGTSKFFMDILPRFGIDATLIETTDHEAIESAIASVSPRVLYLETPTNPTLKVVDIERLARAGHERRCDRRRGQHVRDADQSAPARAGGRPRRPQRDQGARGPRGRARRRHVRIVGAREAHLRVPRDHGGRDGPGRRVPVRPGDEDAAPACAGAEQQRAEDRGVAARRSARRVGVLPRAARRTRDTTSRGKQMRGFGGMLSFAPSGGWPAVEKLLAKLRLAHRAANLGAVETIAGPPATTSHVECTPEQRAELGIPESLVRYSVGIEDADDLIADLDQALG